MSRFLEIIIVLVFTAGVLITAGVLMGDEPLIYLGGVFLAAFLAVAVVGGLRTLSGRSGW